MPDSASDVGDITSDYFFSVKSGVSVQAQGKSSVGPSGARLYFTFNAGTSRVWTKQPANADRVPFWQGFEGTVLSGGDFALLRLDGVLQLDGRLTLRSRDNVLTDATYKGMIDLVESARVAELIEQHGPTKYKGLSKAIHGLEAATFDDYARGKTVSAPVQLPILLYLAFETANTPWTNAPGEDLSWPQKRYLAHEQDFWRYRLLVRRLFVATGKLTFEQSIPMGITGLELDIRGLKAALP